jgi:hypothetical protein
MALHVCQLMDGVLLGLRWILGLVCSCICVKVKQVSSVYKTVCTANALYRKFKTNIPRNETARPCSQFLYSCICEHLYNPTISPQTHHGKIGRPIVGIYKSLTDKLIQKLGTRPCSFISGNICFKCSVQCNVKVTIHK